MQNLGVFDVEKLVKKTQVQIVGGEVGSFLAFVAMDEFMGGDGDEGRKAFLEKRPPEFTGGIRQKGEAYSALSDEEWERMDGIRRELLG